MQVVKKLLKKYITNFFRKIDKEIANKDIKSVIKASKNDDVIRIGFIVQMPSLWDKQEGVYLEANKRRNIKTFLFVVPEDDWVTKKIKNNYTDNFFINKYVDAIRIHDQEGKIITIENYNLNYLFYPRPYDIHLPMEIRSDKLRKKTKCCYIPYGFTGADVFNGGNVYNPFFNNIYYCFMDSEYMKGLLSDRYKKEIKKNLKKIDYLGYPSLEKYISMKTTNELSAITWTPRWSYDEKIGGSNFLEYKNVFLELCKRHEGMVIFRPHPLMFDELVNRKLLSESEKDQYISDLLVSSVNIDTNGPIDEILEKTDVLISDFSSIIGAFFMTGKPIIYCDKGIVLNEVFIKMANYMYIAHSWDEVMKYYTLLVVEKNDYKKEQRLQFIEENYSKERNSSERIVNAIISDYEGGN